MNLQTLLSRRWLIALVILLGGLAIGVVAGLGGSWVVLLGVAAAALLVVLTRSPFAGLIMVIFFLPLERLGAYESPIGTIRASQVIAGITMAIWALTALLRRRRPRANPLLPALLAFLAVGLIGLAHVQNMSRGTTVFFFTAFTIAVSLLIPQILTTKRQLDRVVLVLLISATLVGIFGLFQFAGDVVGLPTSITGLRELYTKQVFGFPRIQSTALEPLYFANYLLLPIGLLYAFILLRRPSVPRWLSFLLLALLGANLVLTVSRGGYLAAAALFVVMSLFAFRHFLNARTLVPLILGVLVVGVVAVKALSYGDPSGMKLEVFTQHVQDVFFGASYSERIDTFEQANHAFWSSPLVGIGMGSFGPYVATHPLVKPDDGWKIVNNETLEALAETGVLGLLALGSAFLILIVRSMKAYRIAGDEKTRFILLGFLGAFVGVLVQYQTFSTLYIMHVWVLVGLLVATQNIILYGERT